MNLKDLRAITTLEDLKRADLSPKELKGEWWRSYGRLYAPTSSSDLLNFADTLVTRAFSRLREAEQTGGVTADVEREIVDLAATAREVARRADALRPQELATQRDFDPRAALIPGDDAGDGKATPAGREAKTYRTLFKKSSLDNGQFTSLGEFMRVVASGRWDPRLDQLQTKTMIAGDLSLGGFAVPEAWASLLFDGIVQESAILPRARVVPMNALTLHVPAWDDLNQSTGATFGGFAGAWLAEGATATEETPKLREIRLTAHKLAIFTSLSRELILGTEGSIQNDLRTALTRAVAAALDKAFLTGTDVGQPEGVLNAPALKGVTRNAAGDVKYVDLATIYAGLHPAFAARATWYINPTVLPKLLNMVDASNRLIWVASGADAAPTTIFGRPVVYSDRLPTLGSKGDVLLVADEAYVVGMLQNIVVDVTNAADWKKDLTSLRCVVLADGQLSWDKVYTAPDAATYSTAVTLNA